MWQRRLIACTVVAGALLLAPATAQAQFFFPFFGGQGLFGYPSTMYGLYNRGYMPFRSTGFSPYFGNYPGMGMGMPGYGYGPYGGYNPAMYNSSFMQSGSITLPGFTSSGYAPRMRPTLSPALPAEPETTAAAGPIRAAGYEVDTNRARIEVIVPSADAKVLIEGAAMRQTGTVRQFVSPPLEAGSSYSYDVTASWGGHAETKHVSVRAGSRVVLDFTQK